MSSVSPTSASTSAPTTSATTTTSSPATSSSASTSNSASAGQAILTALGGGAGFNVDSVVSAIIQAEGAGKTDQLNAQTAQLDSQVSAYSQFTAAAAQVQSAIATLTTPSSFNSYQALVGDTTVASATTSADAVPGNYSLAVTQLAQGTTLQSAAVANSSIAVGTGTLSITAGSSSFSVKITSTNNTLAGIANAINNATGNPGVSASIVTNNNGSYLQLSSSVTGAANGVTVAETDAGTGLKSLTYAPGGTSNGLTQTQAAQDAIIQINGAAYNSASNSISSAISGVTIDALAVSKTGVTTSLTVAADPSGPTSAINSFVTAYNSLVGVVSGLTSYDSSTGQAGVLLGDSLLGDFTNLTQGIIAGNNPGPGSASLKSLAQIGVTVNDDGTLSVDSAALGGALQSNPTAVSTLFTDPTNGVAVRLNSVLKTFTQSGGLVDQAVTSLQGSLTDISTQQATLNDQLSQTQSQLFAEYQAMETVVAGLKSTASQLTTELAALPQNWGPVSSTSTG